MRAALLAHAARHPGRALRFAVDKTREALFWDRLYLAMREPKIRGTVPYDPNRDEAIARQLVDQGFNVRRIAVDSEDLNRFRERADYGRAYRGPLASGLPEKVLEHYLAATLLGLCPDDVVIDVASQHSPASNIYRRLYGCSTYRQDLLFPPGLCGDRIGGDAARMPIPDGFATALTLHNSFEHFEGDTDMRFLREAGRVLRPGGRMCIVPLFLRDSYAIQCDPIALPSGGHTLEPDAVAWCARGWRDRHGRFYDVAHLDSRIRQNLGPLRMQIVVLDHAMDIHAACYARFIALFERI